MTTDISRLVPATIAPPGTKLLIAKTSQADPTRRDFGLMEPSAIDALAGAAHPGGTAGQIQWNNGGTLAGLTVIGDATLDPATGALTLAGKGTASGPVISDGSNKVAAAQLPAVSRTVAGIVPASGAGSGIAKFFREDLSWGVPPGSSGAVDLSFINVDGIAIPATVGSPYVMQPGDVRIVVTANAATYIILPSAPVLGTEYVIFSPLTNVAANPITVAAPTAATVQGLTTYIQALDSEVIYYMAITANTWRVV